MRADIGSLPIQRRRIVIGPENIEQLFVTNDRRIELDLDNFGMSGLIGANIFVGRIFRVAAGIPTAASVTPWMLRKVASTPQKQPAPKVAFSVVIRCMMKRDSFRRKAARYCLTSRTRWSISSRVSGDNSSTQTSSQAPLPESVRVSELRQVPISGPVASTSSPLK